MSSACPGVSGTYAALTVYTRITLRCYRTQRTAFVTVRRERREWEKNQRPSQQPFERTGSAARQGRDI